MRIFKALAVAGSVGALTLGMYTAPAQADAECPEHYVCMWEDGNYTGSMYVYQPGNLPDHVGLYEIDWWDGDNEISSVKNNTGKCVRLFADDGGGGRTYFIERAGTRSDLALNGFDNEAESYAILNC